VSGRTSKASELVGRGCHDCAVRPSFTPVLVCAPHGESPVCVKQAVLGGYHVEIIGDVVNVVLGIDALYGCVALDVGVPVIGALWRRQAADRQGWRGRQCRVL